ncbi:hypothetical protein OHB26_08720 [Nocardia sp. NBC_01503]|uniref:hypothetical protein n=1 Tax=Nocardia sp. NBC_01503 TaxID=2975997 RepID=UPI002E7BC3C8|nr:hypothetical protein [Nocardia sp. NBC_01503]WTL34268.1 hypothetical protein OHB26_08720 [Nocardia sp. NBC_01503]
MTARIGLWLSLSALGIELSWLVFAHGAVAAITAAILVGITLLTVTAGRYAIVNTAVRVLVGAMFAGSVADRFGWLGAPGAPGVSWGRYSAFVDYTRTLIPDPLDWAAPVLGGVATVAEGVLGICLLLGLAARPAAGLATGLLLTFAAAMWTSVGFGEMCSYGVLVVAGGAAMLSTCDTELRLDRVFRSVEAQPRSAR